MTTNHAVSAEFGAQVLVEWTTITSGGGIGITGARSIDCTVTPAAQVPGGQVVVEHGNCGPVVEPLGSLVTLTAGGSGFLNWGGFGTDPTIQFTVEEDLIIDASWS